ncbi:hypothetical protein [Enterococcus gallinarum]|uniref:Phage protein n=1 Tax=Enterococcus gallinarum TaxID=1353 RepID=A0ABD4ZXQ3_ENTGA|nr:hypothetical protein [Enterococcus gallinarum]MBF0825892.1 hypothetical protein [Enterococcus faecalis]MBF0726194.1 hypothetical protein [Enterococcus gallinarum]MBF0798960.1 hypothetical protein [Enterococcus gallinarum]MBX8979570.1 hypothetical protein [Enterococcus gallinarum]MDL4876905.1 hypothetical protein [Enterococcus gallinarum]
MREITAIQLVKDLSILDTMDQLPTYYARFCLDDYLVEEVQEAIKKCNDIYPAYYFTHELVYGGFGHDLVVIDIKRKQAYDCIPKFHTYEELFEKLEKKYGIKTTAKFHCKPTERLTTKEFQQILAFYQSICVDSLFETDDNVT